MNRTPTISEYLLRSESFWHWYSSHRSKKATELVQNIYLIDGWDQLNEQWCDIKQTTVFILWETELVQNKFFLQQPYSCVHISISGMKRNQPHWRNGD